MAEVTVPNIVNMSVYNAENAVLQAGLAWMSSIVQVVPNLKVSYVVYQGPPAGARVTQGTAVHAWIEVGQSGGGPNGT